MSLLRSVRGLVVLLCVSWLSGASGHDPREVIQKLDTITALVATLSHRLDTVPDDVTALQQLVTATRQCPGGWHRVGNSCYFVDNNRQVSWKTAQRNCARLAPGGHLGSIQASSQLAIEHILKNSGEPYIWIGLFRDDNGEDWSWMDGSYVDHITWADGEPNNSGGQEDCVVWKASGGEAPVSGGFVDVPCK